MGLGQIFFYLHVLETYTILCTNFQLNILILGTVFFLILKIRTNIPRMPALYIVTSEDVTVVRGGGLAKIKKFPSSPNLTPFDD